MIKIYNTMTREKEEFKPIVPGQVKMYVCGPTVYNYIHIGNARSVVAFDTIRRYFEYRGYAVDYVSNFTDVDDKIIKKANEMGKTPKEVADRFIKAYREDAEALNVETATINPRAMQYIPDIIKFIQDLIDKGYAYESSGDVYYRTRKFKAYGKLSHQSLDELEEGASQRLGEESSRKEDPLDFALWKTAKANEIAWDSPWGKGRPGWHIECSVMAIKNLGATIDIHGGGQDLEFPHHENEIAQSEAETGKPFAHYWMHNGYVTIGANDEKMSKSLGNFVTVHELLKTVPAQVIRFFLATAQYRRPLRFSQTALTEAATNLEKLKVAYENIKFRSKDSLLTMPEDAEKLAAVKHFADEFQAQMDDDFNCANGITVVYEFAKWLNQYSEAEKVSQRVIDTAVTTYEKILGVFGITFSDKEELLDEQVESLIKEREEARKAKDFAKSDAIRDQLKAQGIILEDTPQGMRWRRK